MNIEPELFYFYRRGHPVHIHSDRSVFERWMKESPTLYPPTECEIVRYVSATPMTDAAPEMLVILEQAVREDWADERGEDADWYKPALAIIAKAKGEPDAPS